MVCKSGFCFVSPLQFRNALTISSGVMLHHPFLGGSGSGCQLVTFSVCVCFATFVCTHWHTPFPVVHEPHNTDSIIVILWEKISVAPFVIINQIRTYIVRQPLAYRNPPLRFLQLRNPLVLFGVLGKERFQGSGRAALYNPIQPSDSTIFSMSSILGLLLLCCNLNSVNGPIHSLCRIQALRFRELVCRRLYGPPKPHGVIGTFSAERCSGFSALKLGYQLFSFSADPCSRLIYPARFCAYSPQ